MTKAWRHRLAGLLLWALVAAAGAGWLAHARVEQLRAAFDTDARIVHRLLSQRVVQHDAVMATLALLQPPVPGAVADTVAASTLPRLPSVYPQILAVLQRPAGAAWPAAQKAALDAAEASSRRSGRAEMALADLAAGRYHLLLAGTPASYALQIDLAATVPLEEWPMNPVTSP
ncbi:MAG: two-component sensor histidine kinase, partial [Acidovorax sp.]